MPTASVAVALAVADALALTVMEAKGVTPEGFAANHPSGQLGRRLTLRVRDVMLAGDQRPTVSASATLLDVVAAIGRGGAGVVLILDDEDRLLGHRHRRRRAPHHRGRAGSRDGAAASPTS